MIIAIALVLQLGAVSYLIMVECQKHQEQRLAQENREEVRANFDWSSDNVRWSAQYSPALRTESSPHEKGNGTNLDGDPFDGEMHDLELTATSYEDSEEMDDLPRIV